MATRLNSPPGIGPFLWNRPLARSCLHWSFKRISTGTWSLSKACAQETTCCNPAPGAWTILEGKQLKIFDAKPLPAKDPKGIAGKLGEIAAVEADGFTVVCADGRFKVSRVQPADGKKIEAGEWAKSAGVAAGARLS